MGGNNNPKNISDPKNASDQKNYYFVPEKKQKVFPAIL
jgi:hypothetical protein